MNSVKKCIEKKGGKIISVRSTDSIDKALGLMRDNRVRAVLVIDEGHLAGIVSQGDCAIKVLLPNLDPKTTLIESIMIKNLFTITVKNTMEECMAIMVHKRIRHLPVLEQGKAKRCIPNRTPDGFEHLITLPDAAIGKTNLETFWNFASCLSQFANL